jgi:hypothetical protein
MTMSKKITRELLIKTALAMNELMGLEPPIATTEKDKDAKIQKEIATEAKELQDGDKFEQDVIDTLSAIIGKKLPKLEVVPTATAEAAEEEQTGKQEEAPKVNKGGKKAPAVKTPPAAAPKVGKGKAATEKAPREPKSGLFSRSEWKRDRASRGKAAMAALVKAKHFDSFDAWSEATNVEYQKMGKDGRATHCHIFCRIVADAIGWLGIARIDSKGIHYVGPKPVA